MDKNLKKLKPAALNFLRSRYTESETRKRWLKVERLYNKWLREEGDLGGSANMMSSNLTLCYAMCAFYEAVDRNFNSEDFNVLFNEVMAKQFAMLDKIDMNKYYKKNPDLVRKIPKLGQMCSQCGKRRTDIRTAVSAVVKKTLDFRAA